jgi:hypothetical protein
VSTLSAAARPAAGDVTPAGTGPVVGTSTMRASRLSSGRRPKRAARSLRTDAGPYTIISAAGRSVRARAFSTTSGPIPAGSPTVTASRIAIRVGYQTAPSGNVLAFIHGEPL